MQTKQRNNKPDLHQRMLPFYMRPIALLFLIVGNVFGHFIWTTVTFMSLRFHYDIWIITVVFAAGIVLGFIQGRLTARLCARYYIDAVLGRVNLWKTAIGKGVTLFVLFALGIPILWNILARNAPVGLQSYIFGFVGGMSLGLYLWVRQLPR